MTRRRWLGLLILAAWMVVVGLHVRREYFKSDLVRLAEGAEQLAPGTYFYTVRMEDDVIGLATSRLDTTATGYVFDDRTNLEVPALDTLHAASTRTRVELGRSLQLRGFSFDLRSEAGEFAVEGEARGDSLLDVRMAAGTEDVQESTVPLSPELVVGAALPLRLAAGGRLEAGQEMRIPVFDPSVLSRREIEVRVVARDTVIVPDSAVQAGGGGEWRAVRHDTVPAWQIDQTFGGVQVSSWVDEDGRVVRAESPIGFTIERTTYELARQERQRAQGERRLAAGSGGYGPIIERTAIASDVELGSVGTTGELEVRVANVDLEGFDLDGGRQTLRGDTLHIAREALDAVDAGYRLPYRTGGAAAEALEATPLIQADDPEIRRTAERIAGDTDDPAVVARRLNEWVYGRLDKDITLSVPSAVQVLESMQGDCNEHTVLYVALARALGLPARTAVGLVHIRGSFYYHAWPEVWLGRWVAVDPTLGQMPADAAHVRFLVGGLARQVELIRLIGRLRLEVV